MVIALLFGGYAALYFCRADLSVGAPLIIDDLSKHGLSHADAIVRMGTITSLGVLAYALGKLFLGGLGDLWGGRVSFLIGLGRSYRIYTALRRGGSGAGIYHRVARQQADPIDRMGRSDQSFLEVVRLHRRMV